MFRIDAKDIQKLTDNLRKSSKSDYPLAVRGTLNSLAFETSNIAKTKIIPEVFTTRNSYIQGTVGYKRCDNTFNIASMQSFAGQFDVSKGKPTGQLAKQETGSPIIAKGAYTFVATPSARGGSYKKTITKGNLFSRLNVKKLSDFVDNPTHETHKQIRQSEAFAARQGKTVNVLLSNARGKKGIYTISPKSVKLLYRLNDRKTDIKRHEWLRPSASIATAKVEQLYTKEAHKRLEKNLSRGLRRF